MSIPRMNGCLSIVHAILIRYLKVERGGTTLAGDKMSKADKVFMIVGSVFIGSGLAIGMMSKFGEGILSFAQRKLVEAAAARAGTGSGEAGAAPAVEDDATAAPTAAAAAAPASGEQASAEMEASQTTAANSEHDTDDDDYDESEDYIENPTLY